MFITFEGIDGSGKTTQSNLFYEFIKNNVTQKVVLTKEPGGTDEADKIRNVMLNNNLMNSTNILLANASRMEHYYSLIKPYLDLGYFVICDRFIDSTIAYQGSGKSDEILIRNLHQMLFKGNCPDLTFMVDMNPEYSLKRKMSENNFDDFEEEEYNKIRERFLRLYKEDPERIDLINGGRSISTVQTNIQENFKDFYF